MKQTINNWLKNRHLFNWDQISHYIFKQHCLLCVTSQSGKFGLCQTCLEDLVWSPMNNCLQCGLNSRGELCGNCLSSAPDFDATYAVFVYTYPVDTLILRYKYGGALSLSHTFGQLMNEKIRSTNHDAIDLIIPMPMHPTRLKERGFNQALEIAKIVDKSLTKDKVSKLDFKSVIRQTLTPPQASLPLKDRVKNIKGAFKVNKDLNGKRIALVDDVMTTGASLNELAKTLKKAGATHVECWVIARTLTN